MSRATKTAGAILTLGIFLVAFNLGGSAGCGSSDGGTTTPGTAGADDETVTATDEDADAAFSAASEAIGAALSTSGAVTLTVQGGVKLAQAIDAVKDAITVTDTSSCSEGNVPSPTGDSAAVAGSDVFSGGSGSCTVSWDEGTDTFDILLDCDNLSDGTDTLDGSLGFTAILSGDYSLDIGSQDLSFTFDGNVCSLIANLGFDFTVGDGSVTTTVNGCMGVCGEFFSISGDDTVNF